MESDMKYAVIKFPQDNTVDVVASNWLEVTKEGLFCYWPRKNFTAKAKKRATPDINLWSKHVAVVLVYADTYEEARLKANQATVTSNLESDEEPPRRPVRPPARYMRKLDSGDDDDDEDPPLPKMPRIVSTPKFTPRPEYFGERIMKKSILSAQDPETSMSDRETQHEGDDGDDDEDTPLPKMPRIASTPKFTSRPECFGERRMRKCLLSAQDPETPMSGRETQHEAHVAIDIPASAGETSLCNTELKKLERAMFIRLDKMDQKLSAIETLLRSIGQPTIDISEYLLNPCRSTQELNDLCSKMKDREYRNKTVHHLSLLGGKTPGDAIRRILRSVALNCVWSHYSMKGRKGKLSFQDLNICSVIIQACQKMHPKVPVKVLEEHISDTLKYAPHRDSRKESEETGPQREESEPQREESEPQREEIAL